MYSVIDSASHTTTVIDGQDRELVEAVVDAEQPTDEATGRPC